MNEVIENIQHIFLMLEIQINSKIILKLTEILKYKIS